MFPRGSCLDDLLCAKGLYSAAAGPCPVHSHPHMCGPHTDLRTLSVQPVFPDWTGSLWADSQWQLLEGGDSPRLLAAPVLQSLAGFPSCGTFLPQREKAWPSCSHFSAWLFKPHVMHFPACPKSLLGRGPWCKGMRGGSAAQPLQH